MIDNNVSTTEAPQDAAPQDVVVPPVDEVFSEPASAQVHTESHFHPVKGSLPPGVVRREVDPVTGAVTEYMAQKEGSPIALNADEDYQARIEDTSVDYTAVVEETPDGEVIEK